MSEEVAVKRGPGRPKAVESSPAPQPSVAGTSFPEARIKALEMQLRAISGKRESREETYEKAKSIVQKMAELKQSAGSVHWRVYNSRYKDAKGNPVTHDFWSDATTPEAARMDYDRRNGRNWSVDEGEDPLKFEKVTAE